MDKEEMILPNHIGLIMDGNGRWAIDKGLSRSKGHKAGSDNLKKLLNHIYERQIKYVSIYAFSTENFKRNKEEVEYLLSLFIKVIKTELKGLIKLGVKVLFSGNSENIPPKLLDAMRNLEIKTKDNTKGTLNICLNYGGQYEIVDMVKKLVKEVTNNNLDINNIDKNIILKNMYQDLPELEFVIRTSGEKRISNFMLYQSAYAEYYFPEVLFPDFNEKEFDKAIEIYNERNRRFGGV